MRYIGSKSSSIHEIYNIVSKYIVEGTFCDPFGGTATVGSYFKKKGFRVFTGDIMHFAHYLQIAKLSSNAHPDFSDLRNHLRLSSPSEIAKYLNSVPSTTGWFVKNYAVERKFFTLKNAQKIESTWKEILRFKKEQLINEHEFAVLIASLIESMDRVANTAGTYYAYLKTTSIKAARDYKFSIIDPIVGNHEGSSTLGDAYDLITNDHYDVIYLDPPYNDRRYHGYYHLPEALALGITPEVSGAAGVCKFNITMATDFYKVTSALAALTNILEKAKFKLLLFHYCSNGIIPQAKLDALFARFSTLLKVEIKSLGYSTKKSERNSTTRLYIIRNEKELA